MFSNKDLNIEKYLGWLEMIIDIIMKIFGMGNSTTTTVAPETTVAETTTAAEIV